MKKKTFLIVLITLFCIQWLPAADTAQEKKNSADFKLYFGASAIGKDGSLNKALEYKPVDKGVRPILMAVVSGIFNNTYFTLISDFQGDFKDQRHQLNLDLNRVFKQKFSFDSLYHRLDHDPLTNLDVISEARSGVYVEDFNPTEQYHINRSEFKSQSTLSLPYGNLYVHYRDETRTGLYQARTLSKCSSCHVVAKSRSINNYNRDVRLGGNVSLGGATVDYSFSNNQFNETSAAPSNHYLKVIHPEKKVPVFNSRIGVGNNETLPFDVVPESKKNTHLLQTVIPVSKTGTISGRVVNSKVENLNTDLQWTSNSVAGGFSTRFGNKGFFNVRLRHLKVNNESIFVNINEPVDVAGPNAGQTYAGKYGVGTFDWTRNSTLSRSVLDLDANFRYKLSQGLAFRLGYEYNKTDRNHFEVTDTSANTIKGRITIKPVKSLRLVVDGRYQSINNPFANLNGGVAPAQQTVAYTNPFVGTQFFQWHLDRYATMTNFPESLTEIKARLNWTANAKFGVHGNILYRTENNENLNLTGFSWNRDLLQYGLDLWLALSEKFPITATYHNYSNKYASMFAIAVLEGCGAGVVGGMTGTLVDMMDYDISNQTLLVNANYLASQKLNFVLNVSWVNSLAQIKNLALNVNDVPYIPGSAKTALNFDNFAGTAEYSKLNMDQLSGELGVTYALSKQWMLNGTVYYYFYDDLAKYLYTDTSGKSYAFSLGFTWQKAAE